jgi:hypothetical protein
MPRPPACRVHRVCWRRRISPSASRPVPPARMRTRRPRSARRVPAVCFVWAAPTRPSPARQVCGLFRLSDCNINVTLTYLPFLKCTRRVSVRACERVWFVLVRWVMFCQAEFPICKRISAIHVFLPCCRHCRVCWWVLNSLCSQPPCRFVLPGQCLRPCGVPLRVVLCRSGGGPHAVPSVAPIVQCRVDRSGGVPRLWYASTRECV